MACGSIPAPRANNSADRPLASEKGMDVVIFALGLIDTNYRFGGKSPINEQNLELVSAHALSLTAAASRCR